MNHIVIGVDAGGRRCYLDGIPLHAGRSLDLRLYGDDWRTRAAATLVSIADYVRNDRLRALLGEITAAVRENWVGVRYESGGDRVLLYLPLGGTADRWLPPVGTREGQEVEIACEDCRGRGDRRPGGTCEHCAGRGWDTPYVGPERRRDCDYCVKGVVAVVRKCGSCSGRGRRWVEISRPAAHCAILDITDDLESYDLRWPARDGGR